MQLFLRTLQVAAFVAVFYVNSLFAWTQNTNIVGAWGICLAYALTVFPFQAAAWWHDRHARAAEHARRAALGLPYGWKRHLPWNARKTEASLSRRRN
jgi:hypothetical protein